MKKTPMRDFQLILEGISPKDKIGHLFTVDVEFDFERSTAKEVLLTKFTPQYLKRKGYFPHPRGPFFSSLTACALTIKDFKFIQGHRQNTQHNG